MCVEVRWVTMQPWGSPAPMNPGPPPIPPIAPTYVVTQHIVHLVLTFFTFGLWAIVWIIVAVSHNSNNRYRGEAYARQLAEHQHRLWLWQQADQDYQRWRWTGQTPHPS